MLHTQVTEKQNGCCEIQDRVETKRIFFKSQEEKHGTWKDKENGGKSDNDQGELIQGRVRDEGSFSKRLCAGASFRLCETLPDQCTGMDDPSL